MLKVKISHVVVLLAAAILLTSGCAKKPKADEGGVGNSSSTISGGTVAGAGSGGSSTNSGFSGQGVSDDGNTTASFLPGQEVTSMQRIYFEFDKYNLSPMAQDKLAATASFLLANPQLKIRIEGHCDERGSDEYNLALGERRADAARKFLLSQGVPENRLRILSFGEESPAVLGHDEMAWGKNRRDEFRIEN